jgi:hypothetical protein
MKPMLINMTEKQITRLKTVSGGDGLPVSEHVRRALDLYLEKIEKQQQKKGKSK